MPRPSSSPRASPRDQLSRPPLERMMKIHASLKAGSFPNCRKLSETLEVSSKTIQRDIDFMRDRLSLPIEYDEARFGYFYASPVTAFPSIEVSEGELVALFVAQKALAEYQGTPYEKPLQAAFSKISSSLNDRIAFSWDDLDSSISFRHAGRSSTDLELFEDLSKAVLDGFEVGFQYRKLNSSRAEKRRVQPYHLGFVENQWYLLGFDLDREQIRTFALPRVAELQVTKTRFSRPADFSVSRFLSASFGIFQGKKRRRVRVRFDPFAAQLVRERTWHESEKRRELPDGGLELSMELAGIEEVERWILSWGSHAEVLEPRELIDGLAKTGAELAARYAKKLKG